MGMVRWVAWAAVGIALAIAGGLFTYQTLYRDTDRSLTADIRIGAPFRLIDHRGEPISEAALAGHPSAVFFGFTHCPEVCPTTLYDLSLWLDELGPAGRNIGVYFVSVDPERDTPDLLKDYLSNFSDRFVGITGDADAVADLARAWHVYFKKVPTEGDEYTMDHTATVFLVDGQGRLKSTIAFGESGETALAKLKRLAAAGT